MRNADGYFRGGLPLMFLCGLIVVSLSVGLVRCAMAQTRSEGVSDKITATALSITSGNCLPASGSRKTLTLDNTSGTINIGYCETDPMTPATPCVAVIGTPPTTSLAPGSLHYWPSGPQNQICFIAASGTPSVTIKEGQ
jgi:hypothetical protein